MGLAAAARIGPADPATPLVALATAHPAKFPEAVAGRHRRRAADAGQRARAWPQRRERFEPIAADVEAAKAYVREFVRAMTPRPHACRTASGSSPIRLPGFETLALTVAAGRGARSEGEAEAGWSHLLEHMVFKGAGERSARDIVEVIEAEGGSINAATGYERTSFQVRSLAGGLQLGLEVIADLVQRPTLDAADLAREVGVIAQEIAEAADTPDDFVFELAQGAAFAGQPLGRPVLGTEASIRAADPAALEAWRARLYAPDRLVVSAAGAVDEDELLALAERLFGDARVRRRADAGAGEPSSAAGRARRGGWSRRTWSSTCRASARSIRTTSPCACSPRRWAAACRAGSSRRRASGWASPTPSTPSPTATRRPA